MSEEKLTKKQRRLIHQQNHNRPQNNFVLKKFEPLTESQADTFDYFARNKHLLLHGLAGTGKTFISIYLALRALMAGKVEQKKIVLVRSALASRDMGFLPGNYKEKTKIYEAPYYGICSELFGRDDAYELLKQKNLIDFISTSFVRGITINSSFIIVDEIQNMTEHELDSIITRVGDNSRVILCGDFHQSDLIKQSDKNGLLRFMKVLDKMNAFAHVEFGEEDIVRSGLVKEYIIAKRKIDSAI